MDKIMREEARLVMLRTLDEQPDGRLNSSLLQHALSASWGINKPREWVHDELRHLVMLGAVKVTEMGTVLIAEILSKGQQHVRREIVITGVKRPGSAEE